MQGAAMPCMNIWSPGCACRGQRQRWFGQGFKWLSGGFEKRLLWRGVLRRALTGMVLAVGVNKKALPFGQGL